MEKLIQDIISLAETADFICEQGVKAFAKDTELAMKLISKLSGVPVGYKVRTIMSTGGGIVEAIEGRDIKFENCQEIYISMLYPSVMRNEHYDVKFGVHKLGVFVEALYEARKRTKRLPNQNVSRNIKILTNMLYGFVNRIDEPWAEEVSNNVPTISRQLIALLFDKLYGTDDVYPIRVHVDSIIVTSLHSKVDLSDISMGVYKLFVEDYEFRNKDVVIQDRIRYIVGTAKYNKTMHKSEERSGALTKRTHDLRQRVWESK